MSAAVSVVVPPWGSQAVGTPVVYGPEYDARFEFLCRASRWLLRDATMRLPLPPRQLALSVLSRWENVDHSEA